MPKIKWVSKLFILAIFGFGVLDAAMPKPIPGCNMKKGATTVTIPINIAGKITGCFVHSMPHSKINKAANVIPIK